MSRDGEAQSDSEGQWGCCGPCETAVSRVAAVTDGGGGEQQGSPR